MSDLISRSKLHQSIKREESIIVKGLPYVRTDAVLEKISMAPSVEAVEVVRCRECRRHLKSTESDGFLYCCFWRTRTMPSGFCHMGAKMDGGEEGV